MVPADSHFTLQHEILILDAYLKEPLKDRESLIKRYLDKLLTTLRMEELGPLKIYDASDPRAPGWSFLQPITTSHVSGHYFLKPGKHPHIRTDIYSCASVNWRKAIEVTHEFMRLREWRATFIDRQINEETGKRTIWELKGEKDEILEEQKIVITDADPPDVQNMTDIPLEEKIAAAIGV
jgi:hypothetical protein